MVEWYYRSMGAVGILFQLCSFFNTESSYLHFLINYFCYFCIISYLLTLFVI